MPIGRKPQKRRSPPSEKLTAEEIAQSESLSKLHARCEKAWKSLSDPPAEDDRWSAVEEHLIAEREDPEKSWKYFSK